MAGKAGRIVAGVLIAGVLAVLGDSGREFISRDEDTLWFKEETAERLGIDAAEGE